MEAKHFPVPLGKNRTLKRGKAGRRELEKEREEGIPRRNSAPTPKRAACHAGRQVHLALCWALAHGACFYKHLQ